MADEAPEPQPARAVLRELLVGRTPVFDRRRRVLGYLLSFRGHAGAPCDGELSAVVLRDEDPGALDRIVGPKRAFVELRHALPPELASPVLPVERSAIVVTEQSARSMEDLERCELLSGAGYPMVLRTSGLFEGIERLLRVARFVAIEDPFSRELDPALLERCAKHNLPLIALGVDHPRQLGEGLTSDFDYFAGNALSEPELSASAGLSPTKASRLALVARIFDDDVDLAGIEAIVMTDPALAHQLLELAGIGAEHGTKRVVRTVREAAVLAGVQRLRSWAALLMLVERGGGDDEQIVTALVRSQMCEALGRAVAPELGAFASTAAMVSSFDLLLGAPLDDVMTALGLSEPLREAARGGDSPAGHLVADAVDYQFGREPAGRRSGADPVALHLAYAKALAFAQQVVDSTR